MPISSNDNLVLTDSSDALPNVATITPTEVGGGAFDNVLGSGGLIGYADVGLLQLLTGSGQDTVTVTGTGPGTPLQITTGDGADALVVNAPIASMITYTAGNPAAAPGDSLQVVGIPGSEGRYLPSATTPGEGTVFLDGQPVNFTGLEPITASGFAKFTVQTPNSLDVLDIQPIGVGRHQLTGTSGGVAIEPLVFFDIDRLEINMGIQDLLLPDDQLAINAVDMPAAGVDVLAVSAGDGANGISVKSGRINLDVVASDAGQDTIKVTGAGTTVNFVATQQLAALSIDAGSFVNLTAGGNKVLVTELLSIAGGAVPTGTLDLTDNAALVNYPDGGASPLLLHEAQIVHGRDQNLPVLWTGAGITSAQAALDPNLFSVVIFEAADVFGGAGGSFLDVPIAPGDQAVLIRAASTVGGDMDQDGDADFDDIADFVATLTGSLRARGTAASATLAQPDAARDRASVYDAALAADAVLAADVGPAALRLAVPWPIGSDHGLQTVVVPHVQLSSPGGADRHGPPGDPAHRDRPPQLPANPRHLDLLPRRTGVRLDHLATSGPAAAGQPPQRLVEPGTPPAHAAVPIVWRAATEREVAAIWAAPRNWLAGLKWRF